MQVALAKRWAGPIEKWGNSGRKSLPPTNLVNAITIFKLQNDTRPFSFEISQQACYFSLLQVSFPTS
jgi:hypothetical protein